MEIFINGTGIISPQASFEESGFSFHNMKATESNRLACVEPDYKSFINPASLRRMSRVVKMGIASAKQSLADAQVENLGAIITATGLGCLEDTEKFVRAIDENKETLLTPTPFIQSTHNTVGGQIALLLGCHEYNYTYTQRGISFESALLDASLLLEEKAADTVLVGGIDELTDTSFKLLQQLGIYCRRNKIPSDLSAGTPGGEGANFFLLSASKTVRSKAKITSLKTLVGKAEVISLTKVIRTCLSEANKSIDAIDVVLMGNSGNYRTDGIFHELRQDVFKNVNTETFKQYCGEYHTASAFALWLATKKIQEGISSVLICNHFAGEDYGILIVEKC